MSKNQNQGLQVIGDALTGEFPGAVVEKTRSDSSTNAPTGVRVTFPNGLTFSIQWHSGAYSNIGRGSWDGTTDPTFETAAWFPRDESDYMADTPWFIPELGREWRPSDGCDQVQDYQTLTEVVESARIVAGARCRFFEALAFVVSQ